jgi:integrin beta 3
VRGEKGDPGLQGDRGERGLEGPIGKFAAPKEWTRGIHYESALVTHEGATFCAKRDTAEMPPHEDWSVVAAKGKDAPVGDVRGLFDEASSYKVLDLVAYGGCEWRARRDNPGTPGIGDGWALSAKQGKRGDKGERGDRGESGTQGKQGPPGPVIVDWVCDGYEAIPMMSDGTAGPTLNVREFFDRYHGETR